MYLTDKFGQDDVVIPYEGPAKSRRDLLTGIKDENTDKNSDNGERAGGCPRTSGLLVNL